MKKFISVAGNIGVGKSSLVKLICGRLGFEPFYEPFAENPYLSDFYSDMKTWAFHSQIYFMSQKLRNQQRLMNYPLSVMQDRSIYEDSEIFARNLYLQGYISERDFQTYYTLYQVLSDFLPPPDLVIYLKASVPVLMKRIHLRGRDYERSITEDYLAQLNVLYDAWIAEFHLCPVLTIPADELDFVARPDHLDLITKKVQDKLTGKEEVIFSNVK
jgi:deoxyadenosine/deoxycytidine kinase